MNKQQLTLALTLALLSSQCLADAYTGHEDIKPDGRKTIVRQHERPGMLLPFPTHNNEWDGIDRPKYWNGFGVDPSTPGTYWYYFDKFPCRYTDVWDGTDVCQEKQDSPPGKFQNVPEPGVPMMLGIGCITLWRINRK